MEDFLVEAVIVNTDRSRAIRNYADLGARLARANVQRLPTPLKVNFCLTYWCQYRCKTCNIWKRRPVDELNTAELLRFVDRNRQVGWLDVTGGEIFLRRDIGDFFAAVVATWKRLTVLHFPTNGFQTDTIVRVAKQVAGAAGPPVLVITVSLDGDERLNDEIRGVRGGWRRQIETFNRLRELPGVHVAFGLTLSRYNVDALERTVEACARDCPGLTIRDFHVNVAQVSDHYYGNQADGGSAPERGATVAALRRWRALGGASAWSLRGQVESAYMRGLERYLIEGRTPMRCHALRSSCFVDPWGTVYPCITYSRPLGRLRDHGMSLEPLWAAAATKRIQAEIWNGDCPQCWTACEAYQSILGNVLRWGRGTGSGHAS